MKKVTKKIEKIYNKYSYSSVRATKKANEYLHKIRSKGKIYDFKVVCDNTNNPTDITEYTFVDIYVQATKYTKILVNNITIMDPYFKIKQLREERIKKLNKIYEIEDCK